MYKHEKWSLLATQCLVKLAQCQKQLKHMDKYLLLHRAERFIPWMPEVFSLASGEEEERARVLVGVFGRSFFLAASRLAFAASPLNSVAPNEEKTSCTQGKRLFVKKLIL